MKIGSINLSDLNTTVKALFNSAFTATQTKWEKVAMKVPSSKGSNTYKWLGMLVSIREWIGDRIIQNLKEYDYTIKNKKFEGTLGIKVDDIKDDDLGLYNILIKDLGDKSKKHPDSLVFGLLADGINQKCYDGQNFFDTDHPVVDKKGKIVSVSNFQSGDKPMWCLLDTTQQVRPLIYQPREEYQIDILNDDKSENVFMRDEILYGVKGRGNAGYGLWQLAYASKAPLTKENFEAAIQAMRKIRGDDGKFLGIKPNLLVYGPDLVSAAEGLINVDRLEGGATNPNYHKVELLDVDELGGE